MQYRGADGHDGDEDDCADQHSQVHVEDGPPGHPTHAQQPVGPAQLGVFLLLAGQQRGEEARLAAQHQAVAHGQAGVVIDVEQEAVVATRGQVRQHDGLAPNGNAADGLVAQGRGRADRDLDEMTHPLRRLVEPETAQRLSGQGGHGQDGRGQHRRAEGEDVVDGLAQAGEQVLVEHAQDDANVLVEAARHQGRGDVKQIVAGEDEDAAGPGNAGRLEDFPAATIARHESGAVQRGSSGLQTVSMTTTLRPAVCR